MRTSEQLPLTSTYVNTLINGAGEEGGFGLFSTHTISSFKVTSDPLESSKSIPLSASLDSTLFQKPLLSRVQTAKSLKKTSAACAFGFLPCLPPAVPSHACFVSTLKTREGQEGEAIDLHLHRLVVDHRPPIRRPWLVASPVALLSEIRSPTN